MDIPWIPADGNPWKVPVLDVSPLTQGMLSTSQDPTCAANAVSYGRDDGTGFVGEEPPLPRSIPSSLRYRRDRLLADGALFIPSQMEHKWAIYHHDGEILFVRSWMRLVYVAAQVEQEGEEVTVTKIDGSFAGDREEDPALTVRILDFLLRSHSLGMPWPAPLPEGLEKDPQAAATWCFALFGKMAHFATPHRVELDTPVKPLRSHSLLHIAVAQGDVAAADAQLGAGVPVDLLAADGLPPLHWAFACPDTSMLQFLVSRGSSLEARSDSGATAVMIASQGAAPKHLEWLLVHGANPNARDERGFTALHRAAEMGHLALVGILLAHGADPRAEAEGHTPLSFAKTRGHAEIAQLLGG